MEAGDDGAAGEKKAGKFHSKKCRSAAYAVGGESSSASLTDSSSTEDTADKDKSVVGLAAGGGFSKSLRYHPTSVGWELKLDP